MTTATQDWLVRLAREAKGCWLLLVLSGALWVFVSPGLGYCVLAYGVLWKAGEFDDDAWDPAVPRRRSRSPLVLVVTLIIGPVALLWWAMSLLG